MGKLLYLELSQVRPEEGFNVRYDYGDIGSLKDSIVENGVKIPLRAYKDVDGVYIVIDGHRRLKAIERAAEEGEKGIKVPVLEVDKHYSAEDKILDLLVTNDGKPLEMLEQAEVCARLKKYGWSNKKIGEKWGKSGVHVDNLLALNSCSEQTKKYIRQGKISPSLVIDIGKKNGSENTEAVVTKVVKKARGKQVKRSKVEEVSKKYSDNGVESLERLKDELDQVWDGSALTSTIKDLNRAIRYIKGDLKADDFFDNDGFL